MDCHSNTTGQIGVSLAQLSSVKKKLYFHSDAIVRNDTTATATAIATSEEICSSNNKQR
jgi:hypothetical protein